MVLFNQFHVRIRVVFAASLSAVLAINLNNISSEVDVAVEEGGAYCVGVNRYAHFLKGSDTRSIEAAGNDDFYMVEAFSVQRSAHVAYQFLAYAGRLEGANLRPQALVDHAAGGVQTHACQLFAQLTRNSQRGVYAVIVEVNESDTRDGRVNIFIKGFCSSDSVAFIGSDECMGEEWETVMTMASVEKPWMPPTRAA